MIAAYILLVVAVAVLGFWIWAAKGRSLALRRTTPPEIRPVDLEAFRNLMDTEEEKYLRERLPPAQFRAVQRKRLVALPNDAAVNRVELGRALNRLADLYVQQADHDEAAKAAGEAEQVLASASAEYAQAAVILGRCMLLADKDTRLAEEKRKEDERKRAEGGAAG